MIFNSQPFIFFLTDKKPSFNEKMSFYLFHFLHLVTKSKFKRLFNQIYLP